MTLDDEIGLPEAALDDRVESQEPGRVNLGAGAIGQPRTKIFHELGHRDEAMPGLQVGIRANLVLIRLDVYPPDRRNGPHVAICAQETCQAMRRANSAGSDPCLTVPKTNSVTPKRPPLAATASRGAALWSAATKRSGSADVKSSDRPARRRTRTKRSVRETYMAKLSREATRSPKPPHSPRRPRDSPNHSDADIEAHGGEGKLDGRTAGRCAQASPQLLTRSGTILNMTRLEGMARPPHRPARLGYFS